MEMEESRVSLNQFLRQAKRAWHGVKPDQPDWRDSSHSLAFSAEIRREVGWLYIFLNAYWEPLDFEPPIPDESGEFVWRRWIDTALDSPHDIVPWQAAEPIPRRTYRADSRSVVLLITRAGTNADSNQRRQ
jgi:glycogen operon protein